MVQYLIRFNLNQARLGLSENGVDHMHIQTAEKKL
jgi:hypothetical protein